MKLAGVVRYWNLSLAGVWVHYVSVGGGFSEYEVDAYLHGAYAVSDYEHDLMAQAVNELIDMLARPPRASFSYEPDLDQVERLAPGDDFGA